jgi:2-oxoglutarate dehydrogenase E2 component (dihydrolipoamide succinyltransferase)
MDEIVVVVESDKLSQEIRSPYAGVIVQTLVDEGADIPVGNPLFIIDTEGKAPEGTAKAPSTKPQETAPKQDTPKPAPTPAQASSSAPAEAPKPAAPRQEAPKAAAAKPVVRASGERTERRVRAT